MSVLSYLCPNTSKEVKTAIDSDATALAKLRNLKISVDCPHCQVGHIVAADTMFFSPELAPSLTPPQAPSDAMSVAKLDR